MRDILGGYIENTRQTMNMIFHQAHMNGIIIMNPVERSILPKVEYKRENPHRRALTGKDYYKGAVKTGKSKRAILMIPEIAKLGHSTIDVTMNIYTHVTAGLEREEIEKIANQF